MIVVQPTQYNWGEPERAPHKRYFNVRSVHIMDLGTYVRHPRAASYIQY